MFTRFPKNIYRFSQILALTFCFQTAEAFILETKTLLKKQDVFSLQKKNTQYNGRYDELISFLKACSSKSREACLKQGKQVYDSSKYVGFKSLIVESLVERAVKGGISLKELNFLNPLLFKNRDLIRVVNHYAADHLAAFFGAKYFLSDQPLDALMVSKPNLLCKFSSNKKFTAKALLKIREQNDFFEKDFSKFPCGLGLDEKYQDLNAEIKNSKLKNAHKLEYKFSYLRDKVSGRVYRVFPRYKKLSFKQRSKKQWHKILTYPGYVQDRIIKNLFYAGKYKMLARFRILSEKKRENLSEDSLIFVVKSLIANGFSKDVIKFSKHIKKSNKNWFEELVLMRAASFLRLKDFKQAEAELLRVVDINGDLKLSVHYWLWVSQKAQNKSRAAKNTAQTILKLYPFTYYGMVVGQDVHGVSFFSKYTKENHVKQNLAKTLSSEERERLLFFYTYDKREKFKKTLSTVKNKLNPKEKALFALVLFNLDYQIEVIRNFNTIWDEDQSLRAEPFLSASFPLPYKKLSDDLSKKLKWVSPSLIHAVIRQESAFARTAQSGSNAMGLMQLLPTTAREVARRARFRKYRRKKDLFKPDVNITLGANYLNRLINAGKGYLPYAFASYNAGPGRMYRWSSLREEVTALRQGLTDKAFDPMDDLWIEELPWTETRFYTKASLRNTGIYLASKENKKAFECVPFWKCHRPSK